MKAYLCDRCGAISAKEPATPPILPHAGWFMFQLTGREQGAYHLCRGCYDEYEELVDKWWKEADSDDTASD